MASELKVLIVAPHASAEFGGESILPLHYFNWLPDAGVDTFMVLHERTKQELVVALGERIENVFFIKDKAIHKFLYACSKKLPHRIATFTTGYLLDLVTQMEQRTLVKKIVAEKQIDLVHEPTRVSPKLPSMMFRVGVPVVIGPMNGGMTFPKAFQYMQSNVERYFTAFGRALAGLMNFLIPGKRYAAALLVANHRTKISLPPNVSKNVIQLVENGVDLSLFDNTISKRAKNSDEVRFIYLGRLVDWKCVDILLLAVNQLRLSHQNFVVDIVGSGKELDKLKQMAADLGIDEHVNFIGFVPQHDCVNLLAQSDCLVLPSVYECGGAVVLEAMAMSKPVVATNWGGPADYLDETCGILVDIGEDKNQFVDGLVTALDTIVKIGDERHAMGKKGRTNIEQHYDWKEKIKAVKKIYQNVLST